MEKRLLFIYNPRSGKGQIRGYLGQILDIFTKGGYLVTVHPTQARGDGQTFMAAHAGQADLVVVSGGDGTLDEVVSALMDVAPDIPVGYIPAGSTNDFGASLGIPKSMTEAAEDIMRGHATPIDVGAFNDTYFVYIAAFGIFTDVSYETDQSMKNAFGHFAYLMEAGKRVFNIPSYHIRAEADGAVYEGNYSYGMVTNARSVGGMKNITGTHVDMSDGLFEVTLVHTPVTPIDVNEIITSILTGDYHSELVEHFQTTKIKLESNQEIAWTLDGEYGSEHRKVEITNYGQALQLVLP